MRAVCVLCKNPFVRFDKAKSAGRGSRSPPKRNSNSITCSRNCSRKYNTILGSLKLRRINGIPPPRRVSS